MLSYRSFLLCLSVAVTVKHCSVIDSNHLDEYYNYQIIEVSQDKVNLKIYYECLCPDCKQFHTGPFDQLIKEMGSYIEFTTYPYGNAKMVEADGKIKVICQHGEAECYGNKLHACAIDILKNVTLSEFYNSCMMSEKWGGKGSTDMDALKCGELMKIDSKPIIECAQTKKGEDLLEHYGKVSEKVNYKYVPYVLINGKELDDDNHLKARVCEAFIIPPPPCQK